MLDTGSTKKNAECENFLSKITRADKKNCLSPTMASSAKPHRQMMSTYCSPEVIRRNAANTFVRAENDVTSSDTGHNEVVILTTPNFISSLYDR